MKDKKFLTTFALNFNKVDVQQLDNSVAKKSLPNSNAIAQIIISGLTVANTRIGIRDTCIEYIFHVNIFFALEQGFLPPNVYPRTEIVRCILAGNNILYTSKFLVP